MAEAKHTKEELRQWQSLPLNIKVLMTKERIRQWVREFGEDGVCVSFSGGKDSTVLLHLVREMYPDVKAVFSNTGLEYPEIQKFVRQFENTDIIRPEMSFRDVITQYGYPIIGKEVAEAIYYARRLRGGRDSIQANRTARQKRTEMSGGARTNSSKHRQPQTEEQFCREECRIDQTESRLGRQTEWKRTELGGADSEAGDSEPG